MKPTGCLSASSLLTAIATLLIITIAGLALGGDLFSPGALNARASGAPLNGVRSHAEIKACSTCHAPFWSSQRMDERCLDCHADLLQGRQGLHQVMLAESQSYTCRHCHTDHNGVEASMTVMDLSQFPHGAVGFSLQAHLKQADGKPFSCSDCHKGNFTDFDQAVCASCHQQLDASFANTHSADFGSSCLACHDGVDTYGQSFDHNQLGFPLSGKHAGIACGECHPGARDLPALRSAPQDCFACHAQDDAHAGQFGQACGNCHNPNSWQDADFDHSLAAFPLTGAHLKVTCDQCHQGGVFKGTPQECAACHAEPAYHQGLFDAGCDGCHTTASWSPARFDGAHTFPLNHGASAPGECRTCHADSLSAYTCYSCHEHDPVEIEAKHLEEGIRDFQDCARCHPTGREEEGGGD